MFINCNCVHNSISLCFSDNCSISHFFEAGNTKMLIHAGFDGYKCSLWGYKAIAVVKSWERKLIHVHTMF